MSAYIKSIAEMEMDAYDLLHPALKRVFDECPRKVSVVNVMGMPNVKRALKEQDQNPLQKCSRSICEAKPNNRHIQRCRKMNEMNGLIIDVEATGGSAMTHSMIQLGAVDLEGNEFYAEMRPLQGRDIDPAAMQAIGLSEITVARWPDPRDAMLRFRKWINDTYKGKRIPVWSDNPAFDWQYVNGYLHLYTGSNPLGFSMRRIGDLYAGHVGDVGAATKWKKLRDTAHTHNALDDAKGNAEALKKIFGMMQK